MKARTIAALLLTAAALIAIALCLLTDWNDELLLAAGFCLITAANAVNILFPRGKKECKEKKI